MDINTRKQLESTVIGSALYNEECFDILVKADFQETDFVFKTFRDVYSIMTKSFEKTQIRPSIHTVKQKYLAHLHSHDTNVESTKINKVNFEGLNFSVEKNIDIYKTYISKLKEELTRYKLIEILKDAIVLAEDKGSRQAIEKITELYISSIETNESIKGTTFNELLSKHIDRYNPENQRDLYIEDIPTPEIEFLDNQSFDNFINLGNMCVIAGRPGSGKSDFSKFSSLNDRKLYHYSLEKNNN